MSKFFTRFCALIGARHFLAIMIAMPLVGCSFFENELNNRGGYIDYKLDQHWWVADTKPMRVLRAYVLVGSVARLAQTRYKTQREGIVQKVNSAVAVAADAFNCAYSEPGRCVYFDERMAELEVAVLQLLSEVIANNDKELFEGVNKQFTDTFPLLKGVDSMSKLISTVTSTAELAVSASQAIQSIFMLGQNAYFRGRRLGALYRDSIELQMVAVLTSLDTMCAVKNRSLRTFEPQTNFKVGENKYPYREIGVGQGRTPHEQELDQDRAYALAIFYGTANELPSTSCLDFEKGYKVWVRGAGDLSKWTAYLEQVTVTYRQHLIPGEEPFVQASDLIWRACEHITEDKAQRSNCIGRRIVKDANGNDAPATECALDFDKGVSEKELKDANTKIWKDSCRLILYAKILKQRDERRKSSGSASRLYWLSYLTPPVSHPLEVHPTHAVRVR